MKEIEFNMEFENFYCPITGEQVLDPEQLNPSPATVFVFLHSHRSFEHLQEDLKRRYSEEFIDENKEGELYLKLTQEILKNEYNYLWITYGGPPFGAVSMCFDMEYKQKIR